MKRYRKEFEYSYALGMTVVFELLLNRPETAKTVYIHPDVNRNESFDKLIGLCGKIGVPTVEDRKAFNVLSPKENCYVIGEFSKFGCSLSPDCPHIVLVNPSNSGNVGTVMRTALGLGYGDIALIEPCADPFAPDTVRASMGALFSLNTEVFADFADYRKRFGGHSLYPFMLTASTPIDKVKFASPFSLVFGNEAHGLPEEFASFGTSVIIPCTDKVDSLNLSVAAAIGMYGARARG